MTQVVSKMFGFNHLSSFKDVGFNHSSSFKDDQNVNGDVVDGKQRRTDGSKVMVIANSTLLAR